MLVNPLILPIFQKVVWDLFFFEKRKRISKKKNHFWRD